MQAMLTYMSGTTMYTNTNVHYMLHFSVKMLQSEINDYRSKDLYALKKNQFSDVTLCNME